MSIKNFIFLLLCIAAVGAGAYWYVNQEVVDVSDEQASDDIMDANDSSHDRSSVNSDSPVQADTSVTKSEDKTSLDTILSGFDDDTSTYDDTSVDSSFSGNLDQGI